MINDVNKLYSAIEMYVRIMHVWDDYPISCISQLKHVEGGWIKAHRINLRKMKMDPNLVIRMLEHIATNPDLVESGAAARIILWNMMYGHPYEDVAIPLSTIRHAYQNVLLEYDLHRKESVVVSPPLDPAQTSN